VGPIWDSSERPARHETKRKTARDIFPPAPSESRSATNALSGLLHWLASQMLFVSRIDQRNRNDDLDPDSSLAACGFSSTALLALLCVLLALSVSVSVLGFRTSAAHIPFAGTCSWVISAACHPNPDEAEPALGRVKWGSISEGGGEAGAVGHCSFSSGRVARPEFEKKYM
jgi:hypothetical protein